MRPQRRTARPPISAECCAHREQPATLAAMSVSDGGRVRTVPTSAPTSNSPLRSAGDSRRRVARRPSGARGRAVESGRGRAGGGPGDVTRCANICANFIRSSCTFLTLRPCILHSPLGIEREAAEMFASPGPRGLGIDKPQHQSQGDPAASELSAMGLLSAVTLPVTIDLPLTGAG